MSWFRSAVYRAVEAGGGRKTNLTRTVRNYADNVVVTAGNAVSEGAKIIQHRIGAGSSKSFKVTVKRLEDVSVSCRGVERVQLLRRWLAALKEIERISAAYPENDEKLSNEQIISEELKDSPRKPTVVYYVDPDLGTMTFHDTFLYSQALEGIILSVGAAQKILDAPNEEEVTILLEIFGLCLAGDKEVHRAVMSKIKNLASSFSSYEDEVLVKKEELLQYAQAAISGLKINAENARIDAEASKLMEKLDKVKPFCQSPNVVREKLAEETTTATKKALEETLGQIELCSTLESLLLKKKSLSNGDPPDLHAEKVHKLKILSESLLNSTVKAERRILDHRVQKEEALNFRVAKSSEVSQLEKDLELQIEQLEKERVDLEATLKKVNNSLTTCRARLRNAREEREHFDEASNQILIHLKAREEELSKSISSCKIEADVVSAWINFMEDTRAMHTTYIEQKEKQVNTELEKYGEYLTNLVIHLFEFCKEQLGPFLIRFRGLVGVLRSFQGSEIVTIVKDDEIKAINERKNLENEFVNLEAKFLTILGLLEGVKKKYYYGTKGIYRKDNEKMNELFNALDKVREEFESIERPFLQVENPILKSRSSSSSIPYSQSLSFKQETGEKQTSKSKLSIVNGNKAPALVELEHIESDLGEDDTGYLDEIGEWEFDQHHPEKDLQGTT